MAVGWALVSTGRHADTFLAPAIGLAQETHLVAVYSREQEQADAFAAKHGAQVAYTSLETLLADARVEVVCIASPNFLHAPYTTLAARAGKHVFVEKPMAVSVDEAVDMVRTCQAHGVKLGVGFHLRHHPGHQEARRLIGEGTLGTITLVQAQWGLGLRGQVGDIPRASHGHAVGTSQYMVGDARQDRRGLCDAGAGGALRQFAPLSARPARRGSGGHDRWADPGKSPRTFGNAVPQVREWHHRDSLLWVQNA